MAGIKIVDLPPLGRDLASTDLLELSLAGGTGSRKITGQEIMNTSKLNIGTTAITSGTVGRVLFEGTGNVVQESANLFWDNTNGLLGIGTSAPSSTIEVVGTAKVTTLLPTTGGFTGSVGTSAVPFANMYAVNYNSPGNATLIASQSTYLGAGNTFGFALFQSTRNVLIQNGGTFTDAGYRLDVNGTVRLGSNGQNLIYTPNSTSPLLEQNGSASSRIQVVSGNRVLGIQCYSGDANYLSSQGAPFYIRTEDAQPIFFRTNNVAAGSITNTQNWLIGNATNNESAILNVGSTTKGFLPPRMTTTQKNAIASPAAGLVVYDSTLNKLCVRTASAWETITSL